MTTEKIALVTGANKGIGFETCRQLAQKGIKVLLGARDEQRGRQAEKTLRDEGLDVTFVQLEVTNPDHIAAIAQYLDKSFGRLDILINNAGIAHPDEELFANSTETVSPKTLRETFEVNFFAPVAITQALLPLIKKSPAGRIVNLSSMLGSLGLHSNPEAGIDSIKPLAYDASKTALNQLTVHLAAALKGTNVKVNSAHPGWVKTDMGTEQAPMEVVDGAKTSVRLATLPDDGPTGRFFHLEEPMPW